MKSFILSAFIILIIGTLSFSCNKDEDTTKPEIILLGNNPMTLYTGMTYTEPGATATDNVDGDISSKIVITNNINNNVAGTYQVNYLVTDAAGNTGTAVRTITMIQSK